MKRYSITLIFCLLTAVIYGQNIINENFESGNIDLTPPNGWVCDEDGWVCGHLEKDRNRIAHSGEWYAYATYNRDKWMYKQISVEAGAYYRLSFWAITSGIGTFNFEIKAGDEANPSSMTTNIMSNTVYENETYEQTSVIFQSAATESIYIGFHAVADNLTWYLTLDDIIIEETSQYNFAVEGLTPDTSIYFGEYGDFRFSITNTGSDPETVSFENVTGGFENTTFLKDGETISSLYLNVGQTIEVAAHALVPLTGLNPNETIELNFDVSSSNNSHSEAVSFHATALQPIFQFPLEEGFENETFPPFGWQAKITNGNYNFIRATEGQEPVCLPHNGSNGMTEYKSFYATAGKSAVLITPKMTLNATDNVIRFWMYRTDNIDNRADLINVYFSTEPDTENAELLGSIHRVITMEPIEEQNDWYEYSFTFDSPSDYGFIIFEAISDYGWNMFLDDIFVNTSITDNNPPIVVSLNGTQEYADTEMEIDLRVYDQSEVPEEITATYTIGGISNTITLQKSGKGNSDYVGFIPAHSNHTSGIITFNLVDILGNSTISESYDISWDWQAPLLKEGFEGEDCPPLGWTRDGAPQTWMQWSCWGTIYYEDSDGIEYTVTPPEGVKQACLEWDFQDNMQDEHLTSPLITITRPSVLTFQTFAHYGQVWDDRYTVRILNTQNGSWDEVWEAANLPMWVNQYEEEVSIDLSSYIGQNIKIDWRGHNTQGTNLWYSWFIDDVEVIPTDTILSVNEQPSTTMIYPNPVKEQLNIKSQSQIRQVNIFSILGLKLFEVKPEDENVNIDFEKFGHGMYIIEIICNDEKSIKTILKQ